MRRITLCAAIFMAAFTGRSEEATPGTFKPDAGASSLITCLYKQDAPCPKWAQTGDKTEDPKDAKETVFHYTVYLPEGYYDSPDSRYPCMFITSPGGNADLGNLEHFIKSNGWIAVMLVETRNSSPEWLRNFIAAHDDAVSRFRIQEGLKYATGLSGGARFASMQAGIRPGFSGIILQGAGFFYDKTGYIYETVKRNRQISVCVTMGKDDSNKIELDTMKSGIPSSTLVKNIMFDGGHTWAPAECMEQAVGWLLDVLPKTAVSQEALGYLFLKNCRELEKEADPFQKYEKASEILDLAKAAKLDSKPDCRAKCQEVSKVARMLSVDPAIRGEIAAKTAYEQVESSETKDRDKNGESQDQLKKKLSFRSKSYEGVSKRFPKTKYGTKAAEKAQSLKDEASK